MGVALSRPTPEAIMTFVEFTSRMRCLGAYNMLMVYTQRPGAQAVGSEKEWAKVGQTVRPDAIPILILQPRGPIARVFELADTLPQRDKDPREHPFAAVGAFEPERLSKFVDALAKPSKRLLRIEVVPEDFGGALAGQIAQYGLFHPNAGGDWLGAFDASHAVDRTTQLSWRIKLNRRLNPAEAFATLVHELGHLFCGHLGPFEAENPAADEYGWPDRRHLSHNLREIEAELVAWHICEREGLATGSPLYLKPHLQQAGEAIVNVDLDRVIRAIARVCAHLPRKQ